MEEIKNLQLAYTGSFSDAAFLVDKADGSKERQPMAVAWKPKNYKGKPHALIVSFYENEDGLRYPQDAAKVLKKPFAAKMAKNNEDGWVKLTKHFIVPLDAIFKKLNNCNAWIANNPLIMKKKGRKRKADKAWHPGWLAEGEDEAMYERENLLREVKRFCEWQNYENISQRARVVIKILGYKEGANPPPRGSITKEAMDTAITEVLDAEDDEDDDEDDEDDDEDSEDDEDEEDDAEGCSLDYFEGKDVEYAKGRGKSYYVDVLAVDGNYAIIKYKGIGKTKPFHVQLTELVVNGEYYV